MNLDVVIAGGGITGLATALSLKLDARIFEKEQSLGGCLRSDRAHGYTVDRTGHLLHFRGAFVRKLMFDRLSIDWLHFNRRAEIHVLGRRVPYPIQYHLHALPKEVNTRCFLGYLNVLGKRPSPEVSFPEWCRNSYGDGLYELFFEPYNKKLWQIDLDTMNAEWVGRFVPPPDPELMVRGALGSHITKTFGYNATFSYPRRGGSQTIVDALAAEVAVPISTGAELVSIDPVSRTCEFANGNHVHYRALVSTLPLPELLSCVHSPDPAIAEAATLLRHSSVLYFAFGYRTNAPPTAHWVYVPEPAFSPYRVGILSNYSPEVAPSGCILLCAEVAVRGNSPTPDGHAELRERVLADLTTLGVVDPSWPLEFEHHGFIEYAYTIFDDRRASAVSQIRGYLERHGILSIGRYGAWKYGSMEDALIDGNACATYLHSIFNQSTHKQPGM